MGMPLGKSYLGMINIFNMCKISFLKRRAVSLVRLLFQTSTSILSVPILYSRNKNVIQTHCEPGLATLPTGTILISSTKLIIDNKNKNKKWQVLSNFSHPELQWLRSYAPDKVSGYLILRKYFAQLRWRLFIQNPKPLSVDIIGFSEYNYNYYHFLIETIPSLMRADKLYSAKNQENNKKTVAIEDRLHENLYQIAKFATDVSIVKCTPKSKFITSKPAIFLNGHDRFYTRGISSKKSFDAHKSSNDLIKLDLEMLALLRTDMLSKALTRQEITNPPHDETFIVRGPTRTKKILNENTLLKGFSTFNQVDVNKLSFIDQVRIFYSSKIIIGGTGSPFANIIFANKDTRIVILSSNNEATVKGLDLWLRLAEISGCDISFVTGPSSSTGSVTYPGKIHADYHIKLDDLYGRMSP